MWFDGPDDDEQQRAEPWPYFPVETGSPLVAVALAAAVVAGILIMAALQA